MLRTPRGWTGPREVDGLPVESTFRSHQVPLQRVKAERAQLAALEAWMRSYHPDTLLDARGRLVAELADLAPGGPRRMGANPHANGGALLVDLHLPDLGNFAVPVEQPPSTLHEPTRPPGKMMRDICASNAGSPNFRLFCPDETASNRLDDVFAVENRCFAGTAIAIDDHVAQDGRVMEVLSEHLAEGWLEGYLLTGRHGLFASYEAFAMITASMVVQHAKGLTESVRLPWRAPVASLNILLTSSCWRNDHNGFSHPGPGLIDVVLSKRGTVARIYLPPDAHPHGMSRGRFIELFTEEKPVIFAFHGCQRAIHEIVHGRPAAERFHVRGVVEQGTTMAPFDMVALNGMSRYHLCIEALRRASGTGDRAAKLTAECRAAIA